jgi:hypothetical protein
MDHNEYVRTAKLAQAGYANVLVHVMDGDDEANYILRPEELKPPPDAAAAAAAPKQAPANLLRPASRGRHVAYGDEDEIDATALRKEAINLVFGDDSEVFDDEDGKQRWSPAASVPTEASALPMDDLTGDATLPASPVSRASRPRKATVPALMPPGAYSVVGEVAVARPQEIVMTPMQQHSSRQSVGDADTASRIGTVQPLPPPVIQGEDGSISITTKTPTWNRKRRICGLVATFLATAAVVGTGVGLSQRNDRATDNQSTDEPQHVPYLVDALLSSCASYGSISQALNSVPRETVAKAESLQVPFPQLGTEVVKSTTCDPHSLAFWWLVDDDDSYSNEAKWERYTSVLLYFLWGGNDWKRRAEWLSRSTLCSWEGMTCYPGTDVVSGMDLTANNLVGFVPTDLGQLTLLKILTLSLNALFGSIPMEIGSLSKLTILQLNRNGFTGTIPTEIGLLTNLSEFLDLSDNKFTGTIPTEIGNLKKLLQLDVSVNSLEGPLPPQLWTLLEIQYIAISGNYFSSPLPAEIGLLTDLFHFEAVQSFLTGTIPTELGLCTSLTSLLVNSNNLQGTIPSQFSTSYDLLRLILFSNQLSGTLPAGICDLPLLEEVSVVSSCTDYALLTTETNQNNVECPQFCCTISPAC